MTYYGGIETLSRRSGLSSEPAQMEMRQRGVISTETSTSPNQTTSNYPHLSQVQEQLASQAQRMLPGCKTSCFGEMMKKIVTGIFVPMQLENPSLNIHSQTSSSTAQRPEGDVLLRHITTTSSPGAIQNGNSSSRDGSKQAVSNKLSKSSSYTSPGGRALSSSPQNSSLELATVQNIQLIRRYALRQFVGLFPESGRNVVSVRRLTLTANILARGVITGGEGSQKDDEFAPITSTDRGVIFLEILPVLACKNILFSRMEWQHAAIRSTLRRDLEIQTNPHLRLEKKCVPPVCFQIESEEGRRDLLLDYVVREGDGGVANFVMPPLVKKIGMNRSLKTMEDVISTEV